MQKRIKLIIEKGVVWFDNGVANLFVRWLQQTQSIPHKLTIGVIRPRTWSKYADKDGTALGKYCKFQIGVVGNYRINASDLIRFREFSNTLVHEFCHYEQECNGKILGHRGVKQRAVALSRRFENDLRAEIII